MKIFLFNVENGIYQGESFENADTLEYVDGMTPVPPPDYEHGEVPVFDPRRNEWTVLPVSFVRQQFKASSPTSGERSS